MKTRSIKQNIINKSETDTLVDSKVKIQITPIVKTLKGAFKLPANFNYRLELIKELSKKYL